MRPHPLKDVHKKHITYEVKYSDQDIRRGPKVFLHASVDIMLEVDKQKGGTCFHDCVCRKKYEHKQVLILLVVIVFKVDNFEYHTFYFEKTGNLNSH